MPDLKSAANFVFSKLPAHLISGASILAVFAATSGVVDLPPEAATLVGIGTNLFTDLLKDIMAGRPVSDQEIEKRVDEAIRESQLERLLSTDDFHRAVFKMIRHSDILHDKLRSLIIERLNRVATREQVEAIDRKIDDVLRIIQPPKQHVASCNLVPNPPGHFAGRVDNLRELAEALQKGESIAITAVRGIGGMGKTSLVEYFCHRYDERFALKLWASLGQNFSEELERGVLREWALKLAGERMPDNLIGDDLLREVTNLVGQAAHDGCGEPVLLVIDDVWPNTVSVARRLRDALPDAHKLVTTRSSEVSRALKCDERTLSQLNAEEGADLILNLMSESDRAKIAAYCDDLKRLSDILEGHPLALELAARRIGRVAHNPARIPDVVDDYDRGMKSGESFKGLHLHEGDEKEDSVSVSLALTLDGLGGDDAEKHNLRLKQFRALGALPPDLNFRDRHVFALWDAEDQDGFDDLVAEGLLTPDKEKDGFYRQHRLLRVYARALANENDELDAAIEQHRAYLIGLAHSVFSEREDQPETWSEVNDDLGQIHALGNDLVALLAGTDDEAAQDTILKAFAGHPHKVEKSANHGIQTLQNGSGLFATCEAFTAVVNAYVARRYIGAEGRRWLWAGLVSAQVRNSQNNIGRFTNQLAQWHSHRGYNEIALDYFKRALHIAETQGNMHNLATVLNNIGLLQSHLGDKHGALGIYEQALSLRRAIGDKGGEASTLNNIGLIWSDLGNMHKALKIYIQALPLRRAIGDKGGEATTLNNIGLSWVGLGKPRKGLKYFHKALPLYRAVEDPAGEATVLNNIGGVWHGLSKLDKALDFFQQALQLRQEAEDRSGTANSLNNVGTIFSALGDYGKALENYEQAFATCQRIGDKYGEAVTQTNIAKILWAQGDHRRALEYMQAARDIKARMEINTAEEDHILVIWRRELSE